MTFRPLVWIGEISFSLYLWHQVVLAYTRYSFYTIANPLHYVITLSTIIFLSILSYKLIEQPFRNYSLISNKSALIIISCFFVGLIGLALFLNTNNGVIRDVDELNITIADNTNPDVHREYNLRIHEYDKPFPKDSNLNVLVIGNSFARDFGNLLLESSFKNKVNLSYILN